MLYVLYTIGAAPEAAVRPTQAAPAHQEAEQEAMGIQSIGTITWAEALANDLGNPAPAPETIQWINAWIQAEGTAATYNPLATSQPMPGSTRFNEDNVQEYLSIEDGIAATVITLQSDHAGYADIAEGIRTNDIQRAQSGLERSPWGTQADNVAEIYNGTPTAPAAEPTGAKSVVTETMAVAAHFDTADCNAWGFQVGCMHWGTDFVGSEGDPVFAPYDITIIALGEYPPGPTFGQYVQGTLPDGTVYYSGHLASRASVEIGQTIPAGTQIGTMNSLAHTHIQLAPPGNTGACAQDGSCIDFEHYYATH